MSIFSAETQHRAAYLIADEVRKLGGELDDEAAGLIARASGTSAALERLLRKYGRHADVQQAARASWAGADVLERLLAEDEASY